MFLCFLPLSRASAISSVALQERTERHVRAAGAGPRGNEGRVTPSELEIDCRTVLREISNYLEQDVPAELRARLEAHFQECNHCRAVLDGTGNLLRLVGDGRSFDLPPAFGKRLRQRVAAALKKR